VLIDMKRGADPAAAGRAGTSEQRVAVVTRDHKVSFRNVKVGPRVDTRWVIAEGLKPGERRFVEGSNPFATA
jgi:membrane fusion protein (multidrug efflux system)